MRSHHLPTASYLGIATFYNTDELVTYKETLVHWILRACVHYPAEFQC